MTWVEGEYLHAGLGVGVVRGLEPQLLDTQLPGEAKSEKVEVVERRWWKGGGGE